MNTFLEQTCTFHLLYRIINSIVRLPILDGCFEVNVNGLFICYTGDRTNTSVCAKQLQHFQLTSICKVHMHAAANFRKRPSSVH